MSKVTIVGAGRMGSVIAHAMQILGHDLSLVDRSKKSFDYFNTLINDSLPVDFYPIMNLSKDILGICKDSEVVISALPYDQTEKVANICIENRIPYCDLGGRVDVSARINSQAKDMVGSFAFTDLGLAPGLVNILAEGGYHKLGGADSISMMVGGLPQDQFANPLQYMVTWSVDGLINEYRDDCEILENGKIKTVKGMDGLEIVWTDAMEEHFPLEAFYTSGGAAHTIQTMQARGVKNCNYKTLRYLGHRDIVNFLIRDCDLSDECLREIFLKGCDAYSEDMVVVRCVVTKGDVQWKKEFSIKSDNLSAMQKGTAFSIASVADLIARRRMTGTRAVSYKNIPFDEFNKNLNKLGIIL